MSLSVTPAAPKVVEQPSVAVLPAKQIADAFASLLAALTKNSSPQLAKAADPISTNTPQVETIESKKTKKSSPKTPDDPDSSAPPNCDSLNLLTLQAVPQTPIQAPQICSPDVPTNSVCTQTAQNTGPDGKTANTVAGATVATSLKTGTEPVANNNPTTPTDTINPKAGGSSAQPDDLENALEAALPEQQPQIVAVNQSTPTGSVATNDSAPAQCIGQFDSDTVRTAINDSPVVGVIKPQLHVKKNAVEESDNSGISNGQTVKAARRVADAPPILVLKHNASSQLPKREPALDHGRVTDPFGIQGAKSDVPVDNPNPAITANDDDQAGPDRDHAHTLWNGQIHVYDIPEAAPSSKATDAPRVADKLAWQDGKKNASVAKTVESLADQSAAGNSTQFGIDLISTSVNHAASTGIRSDASAAVPPVPVSLHEEVLPGPDSAARIERHLGIAALSDSLLMSGARLADRFGHTELRLGISAGEYGSVDVRTFLSRYQFTAEISVEKTELGRILAATLPELQNRLHEQRVPNATVVLQGQTGEGSQEQQTSPRNRRFQAFPVSSNTATTHLSHAEVLQTAGLDIRM